MKKAYITAVILILMVFSGCSGSRDLSPGNYAGFTYSDYMVVSVEVKMDGVEIDDYLVNNASVLQSRFAKGTENLEIYIMKFEKSTGAMKFWYKWAGNTLGEFKTFIGTLPYVYGKVSDGDEDFYIETWYQGKWIYIFKGKKSTVKSAIDSFKSFSKELERSLEL
ncbi:MAG: hypothetical protein R6U52_04130 [Kosmotogaceae bacterium]